jgi:hypothetical protein
MDQLTPNQAPASALGPTIQFSFTTTKGGPAHFFNRYHGTEPPSPALGSCGDLYLVDVPGRRSLLMKNLEGNWEPWAGVTIRDQLLQLHPEHPEVCLNMSADLKRLKYYQITTFAGGRATRYRNALGAEDSRGYLKDATTALDTLRNHEGPLDALEKKERRNITAAVRKPIKIEVCLHSNFQTHLKLPNTRKETAKGLVRS